MESSKHPAPAWAIYAEQQLHHGYGYPLWMPDPEPNADEVEIGDVGWLHKGGFHQLFNAMKREDEPQPRNAVPVGFESLNSRDILISGPRELITQRLVWGRSVTEVAISAGATASG